jgi:hypothetical protein
VGSSTRPSNVMNMSTLGLLFVLAVVGGAIVWHTIQVIPGWAPVTEGAAGRPRAKAGRRNRRSAAPAGVRRAIDVFRIDETWVEPRTTVLGRLLALGRLVLFVLLICAVAGGGLMWVGLTLARMIGLSQGG